MGGPGDAEWTPGFAEPARDHPAHAEVKAFFEKLTWTPRSCEHRQQVVQQIARKVKRRLPGVKTELFGSTKLKTYLPDGDVDITLCQTNAVSDEECKANEAEILRSLVEEILPPMVSQQPEQINAEVKLVKCVIHGLQVDVTVDQYGGVTTVRFLECVNKAVGNDNLFKKSLILIKAWACYEARILGANGGLLGSYALTVMLIAVFQQLNTATLPLAQLTPLDLLHRFVEYYAAFDFSSLALSVLGPVPLVTSPLPGATVAAVAAAVALSCTSASLSHPPSPLGVKFFLDCRRSLAAHRIRESFLGVKQQSASGSAATSPVVKGVPSPPHSSAPVTPQSRGKAGDLSVAVATPTKASSAPPSATGSPPPMAPDPARDTPPPPPSPPGTTPESTPQPGAEPLSPGLLSHGSPQRHEEVPSPPAEAIENGVDPVALSNEEDMAEAVSVTSPSAPRTPTHQSTQLGLEGRTLSQVSQGSQTAWRTVGEQHDEVDAGIQCDPLSLPASTPVSDKTATPVPSPERSAPPSPAVPEALPRPAALSPAALAAPAPPGIEDTPSGLTTLEVPFFPIRSYNILDPLRLHNNLGRSIGRGNGARVQASFRQAAVELQFLFHVLSPDAEHVWLKAWLRQRRGNSWTKIIYGERVPPDLDNPGLVVHFFRNSLIAVERRRVREEGGEAQDALDKSQTRGTQTAGAQAVGVQAGSNASKLWNGFPGGVGYSGAAPAANLLLSNVTLDMMAQQDPSLLGQYGNWWQQKTTGLGYDAFDPALLSQDFSGEASDTTNGVNGLGQQHHPGPLNHHHHAALMRQGPAALHPHGHHQHVHAHHMAGLQMNYSAGRHPAHNAPPHLRHHIGHQIHRTGPAPPHPAGHAPAHGGDFPWLMQGAATAAGTQPQVASVNAAAAAAAANNAAGAAPTNAGKRK